ncbi:hypothetical protein LOD99_12850 [Oopsacas minuta]|uniref:Uncharacterized protein n=1 Tax=Oopsacas minuta TaxID=111878 RepID=A0AAV7JE27_9METZ|nr:hypothetical protein LOD99_12850 [Oopsacas minuta]
MGGILDRLESLSPQGKTYSVAARSNFDSLGFQDSIIHSSRRRSQWDGEAIETERQILNLTALSFWLSDQNVWVSTLEGRSNLILFKLTNGNDKFKVMVHRDSLTMELGIIWLPRVEVIKMDNTGVYWEDMRDRVWGVRFLTEGDTLRFLAGCSPLDFISRDTRSQRNVRWVPPLPTEEHFPIPNPVNIVEEKEVIYNK